MSNQIDQQSGAIAPSGVHAIEAKSPEQLMLDLFRVEQDSTASFLLDVYDVAPHHVTYQPKEKTPREAVFQYGKFPVQFEMAPAQFSVIENGEKVFKTMFPTQREVIVEETLRKMAVDGNGEVRQLLESDTTSKHALLGVRFTIDGLQKKLRQAGHSRSFAEIIESLSILSGCSVTFRFSAVQKDAASPQQRELLLHAQRKTNLFPMWDRVYQDDYKPGAVDTHFIVFHPLVSAGILGGGLRRYDYLVSMQMQSPLARYLYKRLILRFKQAGDGLPYTIYLSGWSAGSGLQDTNMSRVKSKADRALRELAEKEIINSDWREEIEYGGKKGTKLMEVAYTVTGGPALVTQAKNANWWQRHHRGQIASARATD